jgi:hypothetical protein
LFRDRGGMKSEFPWHKLKLAWLRAASLPGELPCFVGHKRGKRIDGLPAKTRLTISPRQWMQRELPTGVKSTIKDTSAQVADAGT